MNSAFIDAKIEAEASVYYRNSRQNLALTDAIEAVETVVNAHGIPKNIFSVRQKTLLHIARLAHFLNVPLNKLERLEGVSVLDIACGRTANTDPNFSPWFCRVAHKLGCQVTGVDIPVSDEEKAAGVDSESQEPWTFIPLDLRDPNVLFEIPENRFDVAHSTYFIDNKHPRDDDPVFRDHFGDDFHAYNQAKKGIVWHMNRVIKPNGVVIINDSKRDKF